MKEKCSDLGPIIMLLEQHGNAVRDGTPPHDAPIYVSKKPINFGLILEAFNLSESIILDRENDNIFDANTWDRLRGPNYQEMNLYKPTPKKSFPGVDEFSNGSLNLDQPLVGGLPGMSGFFTTKNVLLRSRNDAAWLFRGIQVLPQTNKLTGVTSFRNSVGIFEVIDGQKAAVGITRANPAFGEGGLPQVFLPEVQLAIARVRRAAEILGRVATDEEVFAVLQQKSLIRKVDQVKLNNFVVDQSK